MNPKIALYTLIFLCVSSIHAQNNLLNNGDFENFTALPNQLGQWHKLQDVSNINGQHAGGGSPDFFHNLGSGPAQSISNPFASLQPFTNNAYLGLCTFGGVLGQNYREYLGFPLATPLQSGKSYRLSWMMSNGTQTDSKIRTNHFGALLSVGQPEQQQGEVIDEVPQFDIDTIWHSEIWAQITFTFIANQAYDYLTLGNFFSDAQTQVSDYQSQGIRYGYVFIDDLRLVEVEPQITGPAEVCINTTYTLEIQNAQNVTWFREEMPNQALSNSHNFQVLAHPNERFFAIADEQRLTHHPIIQQPFGSILPDTLWMCDRQAAELKLENLSSRFYWSDSIEGLNRSFFTSGTYQLFAENSCGDYTESLIVAEGQSPEVNLGQDTTICIGTELEFESIDLEAKHYWSDGSTGRQFQILQGGTFWLRVENACGIDSDTIQIDEIEEAKWEGQKAFELCQGEVLEFDQQTQKWPSYFYMDHIWHTQITIDSCAIIPVSVSNRCGLSYDTLLISLTPQLPKVGNIDTFICENGQLTLNFDSVAINYYWQDFHPSLKRTFSKTGSFKLTWFNNCEQRETQINISTIETPSFNADQAELCAEDSIEIGINLPFSEYYWNSGETTGTIQIYEDGIYYLNLVNQCFEKEITYYVRQKDCLCEIYAPNTFSPDANNINDQWLPVSTCELEEYALTIYDRYGNIIFEADDATLGWDGIIKGEKAQTGTYTYTLSYKPVNLHRNEKSGQINLLF